MLETVLDWLRARRDPLRGEHSAARWAASVSSRHNADVQKRVVETLGAFPTQRKRVLPEHFDALVKIDHRIDPIVAALEADFVAGCGTASDEETRLWRSVFELVRVLLAAYQHAMRFAMRGADRRWSTRLPLLITRLAWYKSVDARLRLYRYGRWSAAQWREMHQLYELARARRWHHRRLAFGDGESARELPPIEEIYLRTLLEQRMDSGSFTPDQVAWVAERLRAWSGALKLEARRREHAAFFVDPAGSAGLRRIAVPVPMSRVLYVDARPLLAQVDARLAALAGSARSASAVSSSAASASAAPANAPGVGGDGELPPAEERLVLSRLHGLFIGEEAALPPRAERESADATVRVVLGLEAIAAELALAEAAASAAMGTTTSAAMGTTASGGIGAVASGAMDTSASTAIGAAASSAIGAAMHWRTVDRSRTGFRVIAPEGTRTRIGDAIAIEFAGCWRVGAVRRMVRLESDELTLGVEVLGHRALCVSVAALPAAPAPAPVEQPQPAPAADRAAAMDSATGVAAIGGGVGIAAVDRRPGVAAIGAESGIVTPGAGAGAPHYAVYLPACVENRDPELKSIVLAEPLARPGDVLRLQHGGDAYLIRLGRRLEAQAGWAACAIESAQAL